MPRPMFMNKEQNAQQTILSTQAAVKNEKKYILMIQRIGNVFCGKSAQDDIWIFSPILIREMLI